LSERDSNTKKPMPARSETLATSTSVVISSPATTSGPQVNSCSPWTMRARSIPTSGSKNAGRTAGEA
jgi:hypothetical protein